MQKAGVDDALDARFLGGVDHIAVLPRALPDLARRDQEQGVDAGKSGGKGWWFVVVGFANARFRSLALSVERARAKISFFEFFLFSAAMTNRPRCPVDPVTAIFMLVVLSFRLSPG